MKLTEEQFQEALQYLEESITTELKFESPEELYKWMNNNIRYSNGDNTIKTFERVLKTKSGHCHEQTLFEEVFFRKFKNIHYEKLMMVGSNDKTFKGSSHSCIIFYRDNNVYWFENAWGNCKGIHRYKNREDCLEAIGRAWNLDKDYNDIIKLVFVPFGRNLKTGMNFNEFMNIAFGSNNIKDVIDLRTGKLY